MGFGSFFKKKKKEVEKGVNDVENMIKNEIQPENELEKMDQQQKRQKWEMRIKVRGRLTNYKLERIFIPKAADL
jgi:ribosomal protein S4